MIRKVVTMSPVLTRHAPEPVLRLRSVAVPVAAIVLFAALFVGVLRLVESPAMVGRVSVENRTSYDVEVGVTDGSNRDRLPLAALDADAATRVEDALDQGSTWLFRVRRAGTTLGTLHRTRAELQEADWRVVIPASWDDRVLEAD
jgi:hypothetical protein